MNVSSDSNDLVCVVRFVIKAIGESKFTQLLTLPLAYSIFQVKLSEIFTDLNKTYKNIPARMKAEAFKQRVVACFKAWEVS